MNTELLEALNILEKEKDISKETLLDAIENSLMNACKNHFGKTDNIKLIMNKETCEYQLYAEKTVVEEVEDKLKTCAHETYDSREKSIGSPMMRELEKAVMLKVVDSKWMEHLDDMDMLKEGIGLRSYGQRNPIVEYKVEAYDIFEEMQQAMTYDIHIR